MAPIREQHMPDNLGIPIWYSVRIFLFLHLKHLLDIYWQQRHLLVAGAFMGLQGHLAALTRPINPL
jgi:hypothetical protein